MNGLILTVYFIGTLTATAYQSVSSQTDSSPFNTSTSEHVYLGGAAISQDRLCTACRKLHKRCKHPENITKIHYGDCLYIENVGFKIVNDCMGKIKHYQIITSKGHKNLFIKQNNWIDVWVTSYRDEHLFHISNGIKKHKVWLIKDTYETHKT